MTRNKLQKKYLKSGYKKSLLGLDDQGLNLVLLVTNFDLFSLPDAEDGVIFVSFGSAIKSSQMSENLKNVFTNVFSKLKQKILWKWETEEMEGKPDNVKLSKWLPQQDILSHPNLKLFISHMGQSSAQEALCHHVPVVIFSISKLII